MKKLALTLAVISTLGVAACTGQTTASNEYVPVNLGRTAGQDGAVQRQALAALRGICITPEYRIMVVRMGILDPLILMARSDDRDLRRAVASTLNCLSTMDDNKNEVADRALSTIISLLLSNDDAVEADACCAIANLVEVVDVHPRFFRDKLFLLYIFPHLNIPRL